MNGYTAAASRERRECGDKKCEYMNMRRRTNTNNKYCC